MVENSKKDIAEFFELKHLDSKNAIKYFIQKIDRQNRQIKNIKLHIVTDPNQQNMVNTLDII